MEIVYGKHPVYELIRAGRRRIYSLYFLGEGGRAQDPKYVSQFQSKSIPQKIVSKQELERLTRTPKHQGVAAKVDLYPYPDFQQFLQMTSKPMVLVACDSIQDPQNLGSLCRLAYCFGVDAMILNKDQSTPVNATVAKASAGAVEHLSIFRVTNLSRALDELREKGFWIYAADPQAKKDIEGLDLPERVVLVLGSEGKGIRPLVLRHCDERVGLTLSRPFDSLNVVQAASIFLYLISRKRDSQKIS